MLHKCSDAPMRVGLEDYVRSAGFDLIFGIKFSRMNSYEVVRTDVNAFLSKYSCI